MPNKRAQRIRDALTIATLDQSNPRAIVSVGPSWREAPLRVAAESGRPVMELAEMEFRNAVDHFHFTSPLQRSCDTEQRMVLAEILWGVAHADGMIAENEHYLTRKVSPIISPATHVSGSA